VINIKNIIYSILISVFLSTSSIGEIKDMIFATVGDKALTDSDIINEIKTILILNNQAYSKDKKKELQKIAIRRVIERSIKKIEIEKYNTLTFNAITFDEQLKDLAKRINVDVIGLKKIFESNGLDFEELKDGIKIELLWQNLILSIYKNNLNINEDEINKQLQNYKQNTESYEYLISEIVLKSVESSKLADELKKIIKMIENNGFEKTAMRVSLAGNASKGGDIGWIQERALTKKFKSQIINTPIGKISEPIILPEGIIIFTVRDKRKYIQKIDIQSAKQSLINAEKNKMINMYSLSHYESITQVIAVNYN